MLGLDTLVHADLMQGSTALFLGEECLAIDPLSPFVAIYDDLIPHYNDEHLTHANRLTLLNLVRSHWDEFDKTEQDDLLPLLQQTRFVRCQDDEYYCGNEVYFETPELNELLKPDYPHPHKCYNKKGKTQLDPKWQNLFTRLRLLKQPQAAHLVDSVKYVVNTEDMSFAQKKATIRAIYKFINDEVGNDKRYGNGEAFRPLADLAWLPVKQSEELHTPAEVYQARYVSVVGNKVSLLEFSATTNSILRTCWKMPEQPPLELVAAYLFEQAANNQKVGDNVYAELGKRWSELDAATQSRLKTEAIVWDGKGYRTAQQVLFTDEVPEIERILGKRRGYLKEVSDEHTRVFFKHIGVANGSQRKDYSAVLEEIAAAYNGDQLNKEDRAIVLHIFAHLDKQKHFYQANHQRRAAKPAPLANLSDAILATGCD